MGQYDGTDHVWARSEWGLVLLILIECIVISIFWLSVIGLLYLYYENRDKNLPKEEPKPKSRPLAAMVAHRDIEAAKDLPYDVKTTRVKSPPGTPLASLDVQTNKEEAKQVVVETHTEPKNGPENQPKPGTGGEDSQKSGSVTEKTSSETIATNAIDSQTKSGVEADSKSVTLLKRESTEEKIGDKDKSVEVIKTEETKI